MNERINYIHNELKHYANIFCDEDDTIEDLINFFLNKHPHKELAAAALGYKLLPEMAHIITEQDKLIKLQEKMLYPAIGR